MHANDRLTPDEDAECNEVMARLKKFMIRLRNEGYDPHIVLGMVAQIGGSILFLSARNIDDWVKSQTMLMGSNEIYEIRDFIEQKMCTCSKERQE